MKKILITGIDSFTGYHLSSYLQNLGYEVHGTSFFENGDKKYKCDITIKENIIDILQKVKPNYCIHLSGISFAAHGNNEDFYKVNTIGTTNLLDAFIEVKFNPKKIILVSSATVYGNQGLEILDESLCPKPANHYGASKYSMECLAQDYFTKLPILIVRPFNYTGILQDSNFLIPKIVKHFKEKKKSIELGNLHVSREFNDVSFVCEVYKKLLECDENSEIINIATNREINLLDVVTSMCEIAGYKIEVKVNPKFIRKDEIKSLTGSNKKLFNLVGKVEQKEFKYTLREMFNY